jgi:hypothetical protein
VAEGLLGEEQGHCGPTSAQNEITSGEWDLAPSSDDGHWSPGGKCARIAWEFNLRCFNAATLLLGSVPVIVRFISFGYLAPCRFETTARLIGSSALILPFI